MTDSMICVSASNDAGFCLSRRWLKVYRMGSYQNMDCESLQRRIRGTLFLQTNISEEA